ncbi:response regulator [Caballeronia pedi]|uniref:response regulator n=1 Tax=Caballeronia pedi TaxID=1777141 RepID=UPI001FC970F4|nr:response regulator [Caballeronia pedi]
MVEDLEDSLDVTCELLEALGNTCRGVRTAEEALTRLHDEKFDLLFTDLQLPGMSGIDLARHARELWPCMRVVVSSGDAISREIVAEVGFGVLRKPVSMEMLRAVVES